MLPSSIKALFGAAALAGVCKGQNGTEPEQPALTWDGWADLVPSTDLNYTSCYEGRMKCAKLTVPIDWLHPEAKTKTKVNIALAVLPAVVDEDDESFGGTILINPGGPAGSGTDQVAQVGAEIQRIADGDKKFAIMGFDPRGVGQTDPPADCWRDPLYRLFYDREDRALGDPIKDDASLHMALARAEGFAKRCEDVSKDADYDILEHMSTSSVARDMVHIADKMEELRTGKPVDNSTAEEDKPRVLYWGLSYGTALGNYLASMFPGRMERVLLEAVVDIHDYYEGHWLKNLQDTDKVYEYAFDSCYEAGKNCPLVQSNDSSGDDIRKRFEAWLDELDEAPGVVVQDHTIYTVTGYDVLTPFFAAAIYAPTQYLGMVTGLLAQMMAGDLSLLSSVSPIPGSSFTCSNEPIPNQFLWATEAQRAIGCGDAVDLSNTTFSDVKENIDTLKEQSPMFATFWSRIRIPCSSWDYRPKYRFTGPWETPEADPNRVRGKPTAPILWLSSEYDPVTPLKNAHEMAKYHPGSVVLAMDNYGHGNTGLPSACRDKWVKQYWQTGKMPPKDTMCKTECKPFEECKLPGAQAAQSAMKKRSLLGF